MVLKFFLTLQLLVIVGCQSVHEPEIMLAKPTRWTANPQASQTINQQWLTEFADPKLNALVQEALKQNYDLKATALNINIAREQARIAGANRLPQLNVSPTYQREQHTQELSDVFNLRWEIDLWGRIRDSQHAAEQEANASAADYQAAYLSLAARTAQSYFELIEAQQQVVVAEQSVKDRQMIADLVRGRFARGLTGGLDLRLVLTDVANAEAQLATARNQVQFINRRLDVLLGHYPSAELTVSKTLPSLPKALAVGLPSELLTRRPDLVAAYKRIQAANLNLSSAEKALLPRIALTAGGGIGSTALTDVLDPRAAAWHLAAGLVQPIFAGGQLDATIELNKAKSQQAVTVYQNTALNAFREVEQALAAETWLRKQERALQEAVAQTEASQKLAVYSYRQGLIQILTLLDSYRSTFTAQSDYLVVQRQLLTNRINLYLALGGTV